MRGYILRMDEELPGYTWVDREERRAKAIPSAFRYYVKVLEKMGYKSRYDEDGDIMLKYQLKTIFFFVREEDEEPFVQVLFPRFHEFEEGEETLNLAVCNKMTRDSKMVKVFIDGTFKNVSAACEFFYTDEESMKMSIKKALCILGLVSSAYYQNLRELSE